MKKHDDKSERSKKIAYYIDEGVVFVITILTVMFSSTLKMTLKTGNFDFHSITMSMTKAIAAVIITVLSYGALNQSIKYNDRNKPPLLKRIYTHILMGLGWRGILGDILDN